MPRVLNLHMHNNSNNNNRYSYEKKIKATKVRNVITKFQADVIAFAMSSASSQNVYEAI